MPVEGLHHFNFRAPAAQLQALRDFYCNVLGLVEGPRPSFSMPGFWLYAGGEPIVHLVEMRKGRSLPAVPERESALDHVALKCSDVDAMSERLRSHGVEYSMTKVPGTGAIQIFCTDPSGMGVELNFSATV